MRNTAPRRAAPAQPAPVTADATERIALALERIADALAPRAKAPDWNASIAYRWRVRAGVGQLEPVQHLAKMDLADLLNIEQARDLVVANTRQFVAGRPANNVLLTGARGTGKSSLVRACLHAFAKQGLRLIEVDKDDLHNLGDIIELVQGRPERFIIFSDDLSFEEGESSYKALKSALDGSIAAASDNVLIYATSNRRHLMPEHMRENLAATHDEDGELHPAETTEEKISLSERFGLWVNFYGFSQDEYLAICARWVDQLGHPFSDAAQTAALQWARERGARSGRVAHQFARDWAGRQEIKGKKGSGRGSSGQSGSKGPPDKREALLKPARRA
ncbi:MAG TPA: ATP-binding protein [Burkholderiaceae bacterium]|nr:ATP-binding protein [Burkholderiaceae bacterium]